MRVWHATAMLFSILHICCGAEFRYTWLGKAITSCLINPGRVPPNRWVTFTAMGLWRKEQKINGQWQNVGDEYCSSTCNPTTWAWVCLPGERRTETRGQGNNGMACQFQNPALSNTISYTVSIAPSGGGATQRYQAPDQTDSGEDIVTPEVSVKVTL